MLQCGILRSGASIRRLPPRTKSKGNQSCPASNPALRPIARMLSPSCASSARSCSWRMAPAKLFQFSAGRTISYGPRTDGSCPWFAGVLELVGGALIGGLGTPPVAFVLPARWRSPIGCARRRASPDPKRGRTCHHLLLRLPRFRRRRRRPLEPRQQPQRRPDRSRRRSCLRLRRLERLASRDVVRG